LIENDFPIAVEIDPQFKYYYADLKLFSVSSVEYGKHWNIFRKKAHLVKLFDTSLSTKNKPCKREFVV
jgi:hypothetical protein